MAPVTDAPADSRRALLEHWLRHELGIAVNRVAPASADASFRRYFRVETRDTSFIAMDAPPGREDLGPFISIAGALGALGVNVPSVLETDRARGFLLLTDLGSTHYLQALTAGADPESLYQDAAEALLRIQSRGLAAAEALRPYAAELLDREVQLFPDWFLARHLGLEPSDDVRSLIDNVSAALAAVALEQPQVFVHRDYHSRNLMVTPTLNPGVLDFQDAVRGAATYDLVSLFKDCYIVWPRERVLGWLRRYRRSAFAAGVAVGTDEADYVRWFDLLGAQRHLKVLGIFARLWYRDGKASYLGDLPRVLDYLLETAGAYRELAELNRFLHATVVPRFAAAQARALA
ncbi:MAG TPA: phosphotransferase [Steroidobacteraceae bacterium]|nr:phosphotransferase [Steroidobacteraceae bacterium]